MPSAYVPTQLGALTAAELNDLAVSAFAAMTVTQVRALTADQLNGLTADRLCALNFGSLGASQLSGLTTALGNIAPSRIAALTTTQLKGLSAAQIGYFHALTLSAMTADQIAALSSAQIGGIAEAEAAALSTSFAATQTFALTTATVARLEPASLTRGQIAALSASEIVAISSADFARYVAAHVDALSPAARTAITAGQLGALDAAQIETLPETILSSLTRTQTQGLSTDTLNGLSAASIASLNIAFLSTSQIGGMTTALSSLTAAQATIASSATLSAIDPANMHYLGAAFLSALDPTQVAAFSPAQINGLTAGVFSQLSANFLDALTTAHFGGLSQALTQSLTTAQIAGLTTQAFNSFNIAYMTPAQFKAITAAELASIPTSAFGKYFANNLDLLSLDALAGVTIDDLKSMTDAQIANISAAQRGAMSAAAVTYLDLTTKPQLSDYDRVMADVANLTAGGTMTFAAARTILNSACYGGMTTGKFSALTTVAYELNATSGVTINTTNMVRQLFQDVVLGNPSNAHWNGGSWTATALGNLTATSTQDQMSKLIGKWFLGTDNPSLAGAYDPATYQVQTGPLFSSLGPRITDINQGALGDCYFLAALGETALQRPDLIRNMIADNGDGVYTVDFKLNGQHTYITVNDALPVMTHGVHFSSGSTLEFNYGGSTGAIWSEIVEKAYVEFRGMTDGVNAWRHINGGWDEGLTAITGQSVSDYYAGDYATPAARGGLLRTIFDAFSARDDVLMNTAGGNSALNLAADHMYAVTGVDLNAGTISLDNPWNANGTDSGLQMQFTTSLDTLATMGCTFHVANGSPMFA